MTSKMVLRAIAGLALALEAGAALAQPSIVPLDRQTVLNGVQVGCTGIGQSRYEPRWASYPVLIEFASTNGDYLANVLVVVQRADGRPVLEAGCEGPWVLLGLPPGRYRVEGRVRGAEPQTATFTARAAGQAQVVLHFPSD